MSIGILTILMGSIIGQYVIGLWPMEWGVRLHGASNPNTIAQLALFSIFWSHYKALRCEEWGKINVALFIFGLATVLLSLSRSVIIGLFCIYFIYFSILFLSHVSVLVNGYVRKPFIRVLSVVVVSVSIILILAPKVSDYAVALFELQSIEARLSAGTLEQRVTGWKHLWPYFTNAPLTGAAGWWNASNIVEATASYGGVTSPHSLYVRLLSEVGILGSIAVLALPSTVFFLMVGMIVKSEALGIDFRVYSIIASYLVGLFLRQTVEDSYLVGFGEMGSSIIVFGLAVGLAEYYNCQVRQ
jgi:O-antigen ligase